MSSRLFACYTLVAEQESVVQSKDDTPRMTRRRHSLQLPILKLLQAFVDVESSSLGSGNVEKRTVQFSAYDGSSTKPPRDSVLGSHGPRHQNIEAMVKGLTVVQELLQQGDERETVLSSLESLRTFLAKVESREDGKALRAICNKSMPIEWEAARFIKAARLYRQDIAGIHKALFQSMTLRESNVQLNLEKKLAESLGRAIRYHLRRLFNPVYGTVIEDKSVNDAAFKRQSNISGIVQMYLPDWYAASADSAVSDGSVAAIVGLALETIASDIGLQHFLANEFEVPSLPQDFFDSAASQQGVGSRPAPENDFDTILEETNSAISFLSGAKACRFLQELMSFPEVSDEINRLGGWRIVERLAKQFRSFHLDRLSPNDAHFVILEDVSSLLDRAEQYWIATKETADVCTDALNDQWERFDCDTKSTLRRDKYPEIDAVELMLREGLKRHMFPFIAEPTDVFEYEDVEEEEDNEDGSFLEEEE